jgi:hypothetical protein
MFDTAADQNNARFEAALVDVPSNAIDYWASA